MKPQATRPVVAITGCNRGLGFDLARVFDKAGYGLILHSREAGALTPLLERISVPCWSFHGDVQERNTLEAFSNLFSTVNGTILINNAALHCPGKQLNEFEDDEIARIMGVNLIAAMQLTARALKANPHSPKTIVNINSMVGLEPKLKRSVYGASKTGLKAFSDSLRLEIASSGSRVVSVFLSRVRTLPEFTEGMRPERVAQRILGWLELESGDELILDGRADKSLEQ